MNVLGEGVRGGTFYKKGLPAFFPKKQNLRDPIAFIPEVQALSAPGGLGLSRARLKISHESRHGKELEEYSRSISFMSPARES